MGDVDFFVYSRRAPVAGSTERGPAVNEEHWSYMDRFADGMVARGPTFAADRETWTGSLHIVDLPSAGAARDFVALEPYNRAGLFETHVIRRFENLLGGTMWDFPLESADPLFIVIAHLRAEARDHEHRVSPTDVIGLLPERLIVHGELLTPDEAAPAGVVLALQAPRREAVEAFRSAGPGGLDARFDVEILDWEFGGRR